MGGRTFRLASWAAVAALLVVVAGVWGYRQVTAPADTPAAGTKVADAPMGSDFNLVDQDGEPITQAALRGRPAAVFFGFTNCPEVCPTTLYEMSGWLDELGDEGKDLRVFFFTLDPERDTPQMLKDYIYAFSDRITGVTGDPAEVARHAESWHVFWEKVPLDDGDYTLNHTASVFLIDRDGRFKGTIAYQEDSETALAKLRRLAQG